MQMGASCAQVQIPLLGTDENSACCAPRQTCAEGKLKAKSVVVDLWMQMGARCAQVQNAPLLVLQMKTVLAALQADPVPRGKLKAKHVEEDQ